MNIYYTDFKRHIEFNTDENEAVRNALTVLQWHALYKCVIFTTLQLIYGVFFPTESSFCQLDGWYVVKQSIEHAVFLFLTAPFSFLLK